ncbi:hypothetical protein GBA52_027238 [Prunus armeniaca]|nr:hypothetical protein GBA52_027238 [Prunus armeniaca]
MNNGRQHLTLPPLFPFLHNHSPNSPFSKPCLFVFSKNLRLFSLHTASSSSTPTPTSHSSTPIFLPFLQDDDDDEEEEPEDLQELEEEEEDEDPDDPILRFFKSCSST